jgi:phosphoribosylaminoimidazole carboxylase (NCAIR synthetase)
MDVKGDTRKTLLILGSGRQQVPLIRAAEAGGYKTVVADNKEGSPGRQYCSVTSMTSATDLEACRKLAVEHAVCGVLAAGTDQPVRVMATLCRDLGLPCYISPAGAERATNKLVQRQAMVEMGVRQPRFLAVRPGTEWEWDVFPCVVKPVDSQGQRGVKKVSGADDLKLTVIKSAEHSSTGEVVVEEFVMGLEFTACGWIQDGQVVFLSLSDRATYSACNLGVCFQHLYPSLAAKGMEDAVKNMLGKIGRCFGMEQGPLYVQLIASSDGPVLVEAAARVGGGHESTMLPRISDFDPVECLLGTLSGQPYRGAFGLHQGAHAITNFVFAHAGIVGGMSGIEGVPRDGIEEAGFYVRDGDRTTGMLDGQGRVGYFIAKAESRAAVEQVALAFYDGLEVRDVVSGVNLVFRPEDQELLMPKLDESHARRSTSSWSADSRLESSGPVHS